MNSSKTAETEADRFAKALLRKMQKCSGNHIDPNDEEEYRKRLERAQYGRQ
jgi:hypothetical protein